MMRIIPAAARYASDQGWLQTHWLFSFSDYYDPQNVQFGALRVFNDDVIAPGRGFPMHEHAEMEIITIVLAGAITHQDSMGTSAVVRTNEVQCMSAGTGVRHAEYNRGEIPLHLYQIWIFPRTQGLAPRYDQRGYDPAQWKNTLFPVASGQGFRETATFQADATIYRSDCDPGRALTFETTAGRHVFIYVTAGALSVNEQPLETHAQARIDIEEPLRIEAREGAEFVLIDGP